MSDNIKMLRSDKFSDNLKEIDDPPEFLYGIGDISLMLSNCVSIVGARDCDSYGKKVAYNLGKLLALNGITVVSGLAKGIDSYSHRGALDAGGKTIAVLGSEINTCYPRENKGIYEEISRNGLIISEYGVGAGIKKYYFPRRNRIISGISQSTVIVQARASSGSLITANFALNQGREVYSVPGNIDNELSLGTNKLIEEGAIPLVTLDKLIEPFLTGMNRGKVNSDALSKLELKVYEYIKLREKTSYKEIYLDIREKSVTINNVISNLEIKGFVETFMGNITWKKN